MKRYKVVMEFPDLVRQYFSDIIRCSKYSLEYKIGKITKAVKGSLGIFCFKTLEDAERFAFFGGDLIFEVNSIGRGKVPLIIANSFCVEKFYSENIYKTNEVLKGTICYPAVKVIKEIKYE